MYDLVDYARMTSDPVRADAYARALRAVVRPDDVVLDVGCGLGILTVLAAKAGARRVYAVEPDPSIHEAQRVVEENGVADRVSFLRGRLEDVTLPEPATVVVADIRGPLPLDAGAGPIWLAALARRAPGGRSIPRRDLVFAQPIRSDDLSRRVHDFGPVAGVGFASLRASLAHQRHEEPDDAVPLAPERPLFEIGYDAPLAERYEGAAEFVLDGPAPVHAFRLGFEADLAPGVSYRSFGPGRARPYGVHAVPTPEVVDGRRGTRLRLRVACDLVGDATSLRWAVDVDGREGTWQGPALHAPVSLDVLRAALPEHVPGPDRADDLDAFVLAQFRDGKSVGSTVASAAAAFDGAFPLARVESRVLDLARRRQARVVRHLGGA